MAEPISRTNPSVLAAIITLRVDRVHGDAFLQVAADCVLPTEQWTEAVGALHAMRDSEGHSARLSHIPL